MNLERDIENRLAYSALSRAEALAGLKVEHLGELNKGAFGSSGFLEEIIQYLKGWSLSLPVH